MEIYVENNGKEKLCYDRYPFDTIVYAYTSENKSTYNFALVYRGYITAFGDEDGRSGGVTTSYESGGLEDTLRRKKSSMPEFYDELKKYKIADRDFSIDNPELEEQIEQARLEAERRQNEYRKGVILQGLEIAKFVLERELERIKKETSQNRSHAVQ